MKSMARRGVLLAFTAAMFASWLAHAAPPAPSDADKLYVRDFVFDPVKARPKLAAALVATKETGYTVVQYHNGQGQKVYDAIVAAGGTVYGPVPRAGLLAGNLALARLRALPGVRAVEIYHPAYKLAPSLRAAVGGKGKGKGAPLLLAVDVFKDAAGVATAVKKLGGSAVVQKRGGADVLVVTMPSAGLARLAALQQVRNIEPASMPLPELNSAPVLTNTRANGAPPWQNVANLDGTGQRLGLYDTGCDTGNSATLVADLVNRVSGDVANWTNGTMGATWAGLTYAGTPSSHGTMTSDMAIGNGNLSGGLLAGIAFAATALMRPFNADSNGLVPGYLNITEALTNALNWGAHVHNDSWVPATGTSPALVPVLNVYTQQGSQAVDTFATANPIMLIVTSAGNYGSPNLPTWPGGPNSIGTLSCSKDSLVVGNSGNGAPPSLPAVGVNYPSATATNAIAASSSIGPVPGGRLRPDIVAPGAVIAGVCMANGCVGQAVLNQPAYQYQSGTSFSAPQASGAALLLRQYLAAQTVLPNATGMLVKALLINGAQQIYNYAPDNSQGWGRLNLNASLFGTGVGDTMYFDSLTEPGAQFVFTQTGQSVVFPNVTFAPGTSLAITLVWYDPPDATLAGVLVNDLDLTLTLQDGTVYAGGVPSMALGVTRPNQAADHVNTAEKLILANTPAGPTSITVTATTIAPASRQGFALVVTSVQGQGQQARLRVLRGKAPKPSPPARR